MKRWMQFVFADLLQARGGSAGGPVIKDFAPRTTTGPQIALFGFTVAGLQVVDWSLPRPVCQERRDKEQ